MKNLTVWAECSLLYLIDVITLAHASTLITSLMCVKIACVTSVYNKYCLGQWNEEDKR